MNSYAQYCGLARALDVVGGRWTLLIVRELLIRGACRYTDLRNGLPGIATNMLADRLRELEDAGIVESEVAPPPIATTLFRLTPRGQALEPILLQLGLWGAPLLSKPTKSDTFCCHWITLPLKHLLKDRAPDRPPIAIELRTGDAAVTVETADGQVHVREGAARDADLVLSGTPQLVLALLMGKLDLAAAKAAGLKLEGNPKVLSRVQLPRA